MKHFLTTVLLMLCAMAQAQSTYDLMQPFGFATVSSRTENVPYNLTGGGTYTYPVPEALSASTITLQASGATDDTDRKAISDAIKSNNYSVIVLDGSNGPFIITSTMSLDGITNKTILGINNARLCSKFYVTSEIKNALDAADVSSKSSTGGGGDLVWKPGTDEEEVIANIKEERELVTRQVLLALTEDKTEAYRKSGIFKFSTSCSNLIIRNIQFEGPGPFDCSGDDLVWFNNSTTHTWVDHCTFIDGMDGNFDISNGSDFITVSWCKFYYTERAYDHMNTNLVGNDDKKESTDGGKLNVTFAYNHWGTLCRQRMPMVRFGKIHLLNNYYTCTGNTGPCINPRKNSEFLIEGNYFDYSIDNIFDTSNATAWVWSNSNTNIAPGAYIPSSSGTVTVPYTYSISLAAEDVPTEVGSYAGNTLFDLSQCDITACTVAGEDATIDGTTITAEVAYEYSTTVPVTLTLSSGASADSGTSFNMTLAATSGATTDKTIIVTAPNGINTQTYTLTLTRALAPPSTWGLTQGNLTTSTGISTTTTYSGELISSFTNTSAVMGASSSTRSLTNGTTSISSVNGAACQRNNLCPAATDFVENCYYAFTLNVATGYKLNISQIFGDLYYENNRAGKYKFAVYQGTTKVWEAGSSDYVTTGNSSDSQKTLSTSSVEALQGLTGAVQVRMVWYQGGSSSYVALKDFNITAQLEEDSRTLYDLNTTASPTEGGIITLNPTGGAYEEGTEVTITATANDGYYFVNWTDANDQQVATTSDYVYEMGTEAASFTANFGKYPVVSFSKGDTGAEGTVPADMYTTTGTIVVPANNSLYVAGKTLTAWKLGETEYVLGDLINGITSDVILTPVFTINAFALSEMPKTVVSIPFTQNGGAPIMVAQGSGNPSTMCVAQATVGNKFIDVLLSVDATNGKFNNNQGNPDNCQVNATTTLTLPAVNGMKITLNKTFSTSYIGTNTTGTTSDGSTTWTYNGSGETVTLTINESDKYPTLMTLTYPNGTKTITLGQNGYSTFAGEHNYTVSGEGQACTGDYNSTSKKVALTACDAGAIIEKGAGIVLRGAQEGDEVTITYTDDDATVASGATGFVGVISTTTGINDNPYVLSSNGTKTAFVKAGAYGTVEALMNKAYLDGSANSINSFLVDFDDKATGVEAIHSQQTATHAYYTIDGRRLSARPTAKGVYIIGNKITVIE